MSQPVSLNAVKWLQLCAAADQAAMRPDPAVKDLAILAGRLTTVTAKTHTPCDTSLTTSFRWDCTCYALASPENRRMLASGLLAKSELVRRLLTPGEPPQRDALPLPSAEVVDTPLPAWTQRRDIGG